MTGLTSTQLAAELRVSQARVSQYVSEGKLVGCYVGDGRSRRFDLARVAVALGRVLDKGQMLGNGAATRAALSKIAGNGDPSPRPGRSGPATPAPSPPRDGRMAWDDPDEYSLAKTALAQEELRRKRRDNALAERTMVLASEVERQVAQVVGQEIAQIDGVLREAARVVADRLGVDFKVVRQILGEHWRAHRQARTEQLDKQAAAAVLTEAEKAADI